MWMTVGGRRFAITLADTAAARAFAAQLPLTLDMAELNGNEKHADLAVTLPTDTSRPGTIRNGDLMLYGSNTVVVLQPIGDPPDKIRIPDQARSASIKGPVPMIFITRFRLYARTCRLISALTLGSRRHKKCVVPIQALIVPNGCSAVRRRTCIASGLASSRLCILSSRSWPEGARRFRQDRDSLRHPWWLWAGQQPIRPRQPCAKGAASG